MWDLLDAPKASGFQAADNAIDKTTALLYHVRITGVMKKSSVAAQYPVYLSVENFAIELPGEGKTRWIVNDRIESGRRHGLDQLKTITLTLHNSLFG